MKLSSVLFVRVKRKRGIVKFCLLVIRMNSWVCEEVARLERERIKVTLNNVGGVEFTGTGEGISQKPKTRGHFLWNERKAGTDGHR